jgi:hypothetical protein
MISTIVADLKEAFLSLVDSRRKWPERGKFCLMGTMVNSDGGVMMGIKVRLGAANTTLT